MVLFRTEQQRLVEAGAVRVTYRAWQSPRVKVGAKYRLGAGHIEIHSCDAVAVSSITGADAAEAGFANSDAVITAAAYRRPDGLAFPDTLYRVTFSYEAAPTGREPETGHLSSADAAMLTKKLDAMDQRSSFGPWTRQTLQIIADNPGVVSSILAEQLGRHRPDFKLDVRKLKALGLTISLLTGYELSPRGQALLDSLDPVSSN